MGYIKHNAIVITGQKEGIATAVEQAIQIGLQVLGPSDITTNGYCSMMICPDGSKEGWTESHDGDRKRETFRLWLADCDYTFEWTEVSYGYDDGCARIVDSCWGRGE